jgi:hypothetical protein
LPPVGPTNLPPLLIFPPAHSLSSFLPQPAPTPLAPVLARWRYGGARPRGPARPSAPPLSCAVAEEQDLAPGSLAATRGEGEEGVALPAPSARPRELADVGGGGGMRSAWSSSIG